MMPPPRPTNSGVRIKTRIELVQACALTCSNKLAALPTCMDLFGAPDGRLCSERISNSRRSENRLNEAAIATLNLAAGRGISQHHDGARLGDPNCKRKLD